MTPVDDANDKMMNVIAVTTDSDNRRVYYSDIQRRALSWVSYNRSETGDILTGYFLLSIIIHYTPESLTYTITKQICVVVIVVDVDPIEGMHYDNNKIYFTQQAGTSGTEPRIATVDVSGTDYPVKAIVRLHKHDAPRAIAVHSCKG